MTAPLSHKLDARRCAARAIGYALEAQDPESWHRLVVIFGARLTADELAALAWAAMTAARREDAQDVAWQVLGEAGPPCTPFGPIWPEARAWAETASDAERKAYAAACVERMSVATRTAFVRWAQGGQA